MKISKTQKHLIFVILLLFSSVLTNQYYGNLGVQPIDSFSLLIPLTMFLVDFTHLKIIGQ